jgi:hypothetical protein
MISFYGSNTFFYVKNPGGIHLVGKYTNYALTVFGWESTSSTVYTTFYSAINDFNAGEASITNGTNVFTEYLPRLLYSWDINTTASATNEYYKRISTTSPSFSTFPTLTSVGTNTYTTTSGSTRTFQNSTISTFSTTDIAVSFVDGSSVVTASSVGLQQNILYYDTYNFYAKTNSELSPLYDVPTATYTSFDFSTPLSSRSISVYDVLLINDTFVSTRNIFLISYFDDSIYTTSLITRNIIYSFPQSSSSVSQIGNYLHLSTTLISQETYTGTYGNEPYFLWSSSGEFSTSSTGSWANRKDELYVYDYTSYVPGSVTVFPLNPANFINFLSVSSYVGSGASLPLGTWVSNQDRSVIPAWYGGNAEIYLDWFDDDYMMSRTIYIPPVGSFVSTKTNSNTANTIQTTITVSIDESYKCSSTWIYGTIKSSGTMQLQTYNQNSIYLDERNDILGGFPEINRSYTFVRPSGAYVVTTGDNSGYGTTTQSFASGASSSALMTNGAVTISQPVSMIQGLQPIPIMTYDF